MAMSPYDVNTLTYLPPIKTEDDLSGTTKVALAKGFKAHILVFQGYVTYINDIGEPIDD